MFSSTAKLPLNDAANACWRLFSAANNVSIWLGVVELSPSWFMGSQFRLTRRRTGDVLSETSARVEQKTHCIDEALGVGGESGAGFARGYEANGHEEAAGAQLRLRLQHRHAADATDMKHQLP